MSEVTLQVGGRPYTVSCADGEETHVRQLAAIVDGKLAAMGDNLPPGDAKNLLFAALILADEIVEANRATKPARDGTAESQFELTMGRRLESMADRLENIAKTLEGAGQSA